MTSADRTKRSRPVRIAVALVAPVVVFVVLVALLGNATEALAVTGAMPLAWVVAQAIRRRRIEPLGVAAVVFFALALLLTIVFGGNPRPLELHRALFPGAVGLACLISLAVGRPLLSILAERRRSAGGQTANRSAGDMEGAYRALRVMTGIIGVTLTADATAQVVLAFTVSASTFGVVSHIASWTIIGTGLAVAAVYVRGIRARLQHTRPGPSA